ncbi:hypothetical protein HBH86_132950 [Parastagonospora nodorum]|nr:hypothetical protein HBH86_132950 [Parastagonospora nodorum]
MLPRHPKEPDSLRSVSVGLESIETSRRSVGIRMHTVKIERGGGGNSYFYNFHRTDFDALFDSDEPTGIARLEGWLVWSHYCCVATDISGYSQKPTYNCRMKFKVSFITCA